MFDQCMTTHVLIVAFCFICINVWHVGLLCPGAGCQGFPFLAFCVDSWVCSDVFRRARARCVNALHVYHHIVARWPCGTPQHSNMGDHQICLRLFFFSFFSPQLPCSVYWSKNPRVVGLCRLVQLGDFLKMLIPAVQSGLWRLIGSGAAACDHVCMRQAFRKLPFNVLCFVFLIDRLYWK